MTANVYSPCAIEAPPTKFVDRGSCILSEIADGHWRSLNQQFFALRLRPIPILWSRRLTSSLGVFVGYRGTSPSILPGEKGRTDRCLIRLSYPLFQDLSATPLLADTALRETIAHEMIHQWQFQVLHKTPNHGTTFRQLMHQMNAAGLAVSVYHRYGAHTHRLIRFVWACQACGLQYPRQRKSIDPRRHRCGRCRGMLTQIDQDASDRQANTTHRANHSLPINNQLALLL